MKKKFVLSAIFPLLFLANGIVLGQNTVDSPTGPTGVYNGNITTAANYDPATGNQMRIVDDLVVPGSVGAYPLKWTRYFNTNVQDGQWTFAYKDYQPNKMPDGRIIGGGPSDGRGVPDYEGLDSNYLPVIFLSDGGQVHFARQQVGSAFYYRATQLIDPYGLVTNLSYTNFGTYPVYVLDRVTEPGGRYLQLTWQNTPATTGGPVISRVEAFDGRGNSLGWVNYDVWSASDQGQGNGLYPVLKHVTYSDQTTASYTYAPVQIFSDGGLQRSAPDLYTADDVRYEGAMRQIAYGRANSSGNFEFAIASESNFNTHETLSFSAFAFSDAQQVGGTWVETKVTNQETRADGATRTFTYSIGTCTWTNPIRETLECNDDPNRGKLIQYTDFYGHSTLISYEPLTAGIASSGYIHSVTDPNNRITTYTRATPDHNTWNVTRIDYADGSFMTQSYTDDANPYYLASRMAPRFDGDPVYTTTYTRDGNHRITRKDYPDGSYETFSYNNFGQVLTHRLQNGAFQHFSYDGRALLLAKTNPTWNSDHDNSLMFDPHTTYSYYASGPWTDRVQSETDPRGITNQYEYDHQFDANGNETTTQATGVGRVTKITHLSDNTSQTFGYSKYGDKLSEENEMHQRTLYDYDEYGRVTKVTDPLGHYITYDYRKGGTLSATATTSKEPFSTTLPAGETTQTIYDANWRKITVATLDGTSSPPTSTFIYDSFNGYTSIGNLIATQDPRGNITKYTYDSRNRKFTATDPLNLTTTFHYDAVGNVRAIDRPDGTTESKVYDSMNRVLTDTVPKSGTASNVTEWVTTTFEYYPGSASQMAGQLWHLTDGKGQTTTFEYDPAGMKTKMTYPNNTDFQGWTYDPDHNLIARRTVNSASQLFNYDSRNRQISMSWSNAADWATFGYDDVGRMTLAQSPTSTITRGYDDAGRLTLDRQQLHISPITAVSRKTHGTAGTFDVTLPLTGSAGIECRLGQGKSQDRHQIVVTFPRAVSFSSASITTGTGSVTSMSQSPDHTQIFLTLSVTNGQTIIVTIVGVTDGNVTNDVTVGMAVQLGDTNADRFTDSIDKAQVQSQSGQTVTTSNFREDVNCDGFIDSIDTAIVMSKSGTALPSAPALTQPGSTGPNLDVQYSYDSSNKNTRLFVTSAGADTRGYDLTYTYDTLGRFEKIFATGGGQLFQYSYDAASNETHRTNNVNGVDQVYGRDQLNRITERDVVAGGAALSVEAYGYDPARPGLMTSVTRQELGQQHSTQDIFGYDLLPEMMSAQYNVPNGGVNMGGPAPNPPLRTVSYGWDKAGNRSSMTDSAGTACSYGTNNLNQYWTDGINPITSGSEHELASYQNVSYSYINDTHLKSVSGTDVFGQQSKYETYYDALGRRVVSVLNGSVTYYVNDGEKAILEYRGWSGPTAANVYGRGIDEILQRTDYTVTPARIVYYQDDHEGSITQLTNGNGNVIEWYRYDSFGKPSIYDANGNQIATSAFGNRFMFTGREYVASFGIYEYRNRAYHPGLGRFMSEDPKGFGAGDNNFFRYVSNDPLDRVDPMGLDTNTELHVRVQNAGDQNTDTNPDDGPARGHDFESDLDRFANEGEVSISAHELSAVRHSATEAKQGVINSIVGKAYTDKLAAGKAGALADYKAIEIDIINGRAKTEYWGGIFQDKGSGSYFVTGPNKGAGSGAGVVLPGASGAYSDMRFTYNPATVNFIGEHYAHFRPMDLIKNQPGDITRIQGLAVVAAPRRGDINLEGRPVYQAYDATTGKFYGDQDFNRYRDENGW